MTANLTRAQILLKVARAMERGTLAGHVTVSSSKFSGTEVGIGRMQSLGDELAAERDLLAWCKKNFGEGHVGAWGGPVQRKKYVGGRYRSTYFDVMRWVVADLSVEMKFLVEHEHQSADLRGYILANGTVSWSCSRCRRALRSADAKRLGLPLMVAA